MPCISCQSDRIRRFRSEICLHFQEVGNLDKPSVFVFPEIVVCLVCGEGTFRVPEDRLVRLRDDVAV